MTNRFGALVTGFSLVLFSSAILAAELEGKIESINKGNQSFVVRGTEFIVTSSTEYENLKGFDDLRQGLNVEVEYLLRDRRPRSRKCSYAAPSGLPSSHASSASENLILLYLMRSCTST